MVIMVSKQEIDINLSKLKKLGVFPVKLYGEIYTAPFSQKSCLWFEWIRNTNMPTLDSGYTFGYGTGYKSNITAKGTFGHLTIYPDRIMLYLAPSFDDKVNFEGKEQHITEFCLVPDQSYYAFVEKFIYHPPPFRFFPFIPRQKVAWILALSDKPVKKGGSLNPLIPTRRGMTG